MWQQEVQNIHLARCKLAPEIPLPSISRTIITMRLDVPLQRLVLLKHVIREIQWPDETIVHAVDKATAKILFSYMLEDSRSPDSEE